jgi:hypothetical protein
VRTNVFRATRCLFPHLGHGLETWVMVTEQFVCHSSAPYVQAHTKAPLSTLLVCCCLQGVSPYDAQLCVGVWLQCAGHPSGCRWVVGGRGFGSMHCIWTDTF